MKLQIFLPLVTYPDPSSEPRSTTPLRIGVLERRSPCACAGSGYTARVEWAVAPDPETFRDDPRRREAQQTTWRHIAGGSARSGGGRIREPDDGGGAWTGGFPRRDSDGDARYFDIALIGWATGNPGIRDRGRLGHVAIDWTAAASPPAIADARLLLSGRQRFPSSPLQTKSRSRKGRGREAYRNPAP